jgi:hypothetical protein
VNTAPLAPMPAEVAAELCREQAQQTTEEAFGADI